MLISSALAQTPEGTWRVSPVAQALAVGPNQGDTNWWSNSTADVNTRACLFDDTYVFNSDGSFENVLGNETWRESWQGVSEGCGAPVAPNNTVMSRKGVCWSTAQNPTVADNLSDNGFGNDNFEAYIFGLLPNTTYHYRAYAEDCNGVYYGNEMSFTTPQ